MNAFPDTRRLFVIIVALGLFTMAARNVTDPDVWWHLETGKLILQNHAVFHSDPYSFTRLGRPWINHEWLSDLLIFALYRATGWLGLIAAFAAMTSAAFTLMFLRCGKRPVVAAGFIAWGALAAAPAWGVRPQTLSFLLASVFLLLLEQSEVRPRALWWLLPLMPLWINLHAEFAAGIALVSAFLIGELLEIVLAFNKPSDCFPRLKRLSLVCGAFLAFVPLNPFGAQMYRYPLQTLHSPGMQTYISEWASPNSHTLMYLPFVLLLLATFVLAGVSPLRIRPRDLLLLLMSAWAALHSARHVPIFVLVAAPIVSRLADAYFDEKWPNFAKATDVHEEPFRMTVNAIVVVLFLMLAAFRLRHTAQSQSCTESSVFPASAVSFLQQNHLPPQLFNSYNWGGYLIWKLYPNFPVCIDGRADLYGDAFMKQFAVTYQISDASWRASLDQWRINTVILPRNAPLVAALRLLPDWKEVYRDSQAAILERAGP